MPLESRYNGCNVPYFRNHSVDEEVLWFSDDFSLLSSV